MMAEEMCQGKQSCSIDTGVNILAPGSQDPCPGVRYGYTGSQDPCPGVRLHRQSGPFSWCMDTGVRTQDPGPVRFGYRSQDSGPLSCKVWIQESGLLVLV